jgi:16S rRNA (cytosine1402-N4)-methyltransferase
MSDANLHIPVLLQESIDSLNLKTGDTVVDCTVNYGGHAEMIAKAIGKAGKLIIFDLDLQALKSATERLQKLENAPQIFPIHSNYRFLKEKLERLGIEKVDAIFADLGLSSQELDISGRGFSFRFDEPLLMTFQSEVRAETLTAKDLLNTLGSEQLANIFKAYGDEMQARKIAEEIVRKRGEKNFETTFDLVNAVISAVGRKPWLKTHPATRIFQALRIAVNDEYDGVKDLLESGFEKLKAGGQFSIITFHSGEDRLVKEFFREKYKENLSSKPNKIKPIKEEITKNSRSRSAILRNIQKT